jgi:hypothetical protein
LIRAICSTAMSSRWNPAIPSRFESSWEPDWLKLNGNWQAAIKKSLQKKRPVSGWPKPGN